MGHPVDWEISLAGQPLPQVPISKTDPHKSNNGNACSRCDVSPCILEGGLWLTLLKKAISGLFPGIFLNSVLRYLSSKSSSMNDRTSGSLFSRHPPQDSAKRYNISNLTNSALHLRRDSLSTEGDGAPSKVDKTLEREVV